MPCAKQGGVCVCFHCVFMLFTVIAAFDQVEIIPGILTISYLVFNILPVSCLFVCLFVCMFCSLVSKPGASTETAWLIGEGWAVGGMEVGEQGDKLFAWNKAKKMPCIWEQVSELKF